MVEKLVVAEELAIGVVVNSLTHLEEILPTVLGLDKRHVAYGVEPKHYDTVGTALLWALEQGLR